MINDPKIRRTLNALHKEAKWQLPAILWNLRRGIFRKLKPEDMADVHISMGLEEGLEMYRLIIDNNCTSIVEFGTSFGISTIYLAAASKKTGGRVVTTEILENKALTAEQNFQKAGLDEIIDIRIGDAIKTLDKDPEEIDFLLLDGWNDMYLPLLKLLEPRFKNGCILVADNANMRSSQPFNDHIINDSRYTPMKNSSKNDRTAFFRYNG